MKKLALFILAAGLFQQYSFAEDNDLLGQPTGFFDSPPITESTEEIITPPDIGETTYDETDFTDSGDMNGGDVISGDYIGDAGDASDSVFANGEEIFPDPGMEDFLDLGEIVITDGGEPWTGDIEPISEEITPFEGGDSSGNELFRGTEMVPGDFSGVPGDFKMQNGNFETMFAATSASDLQAVPEPSTISLMVIAGGVLALATRKRRKA